MKAGKPKRPILIWLASGFILVFLMIAVGGITRLTESGLSMVDWQPILGTVPPMSDQEWNEAFDAYKAYPEFKELNTHFTQEDFKSIFFWEYFHRLLGRIIGLAFFIPFVIFMLKGYFTRKFSFKLILLMILGGTQGLLGWYMVQSGLVLEPRVSHFRLAAHLSTALITMMYILALFLEVKYPKRDKRQPKFKPWVISALVLLGVQIVYGAFVAGRDAGTAHNYFPHMNPGEFISPAAFDMTPLLENFLNNNSGIQFIHRYLAYVVVAVMLVLFFKGQKFKFDLPARFALRSIPILVLVQFGLGVLTLVYAVPLALGLLHQLGAVLLLSATVTLWLRVR